MTNPTPWQTEEHAGKLSICDANGDAVIINRNTLLLIVKAVNAHDDLVKSVEAFLKATEGKAQFALERDFARAAMAKAGAA